MNYDDPATVVAALRGQDALVITINGRAFAGTDIQRILLSAAAEANVPWVLPNEWGLDYNNEQLATESLDGIKKLETRRWLHSGLPNAPAFVAVTCGFWYEYSLALPITWGFDFAQKKLSLTDNGAVKQNVSTWPQVGRAVAKLLSLPIEKEEGAAGCLDDYRNGVVYVSSFCLSQRDMLASVLRVTGSQKSEWAIDNVDGKGRWEAGQAAMKSGDRSGFISMMYASTLRQDRDEWGVFEKTRGLSNKLLKLPGEDLDEFTRVAIERAAQT